MSAAYATVADVSAISGVTYTEAQQTRIGTLLPLVSDLIRNEGAKAGKDIDAMAAASESYASVVKLVTCDVVARAMRQSSDGAPLSQESQSALGYSWSGTYAIPGGGVAMSLMNNERKMLGLKRQRFGVIELWQADSTE